MGVTTAENASPDTMANNIKSIQSATGDATEANVLAGKTFSNSSGVGKTGTMKDNGAVSKTITPSSSAQTYTIPAGYHNGSGKVTVSAASIGYKFTKTFRDTSAHTQTATLDITSNYSNYKNITISNIIVQQNTQLIANQAIPMSNGLSNLTYSYNATTGIITAKCGNPAYFYKGETYSFTIAII